MSTQLKWQSRVATSVLIISSALFSRPTVAGELAISCEHGILRELHEILLYCGDPPHPLQEERFVALEKELAEFIRRNRRAEEHHWSTTDDIRKGLLREGAARICHDPDYPKIKAWFYRFVSSEGMATVRERLRTPEDPDAGDCL